jgi:glutamate-1-semialdehyde 2,1-aminomutase
MKRSGELYARACEVIPGGVNSPVRAFRSVGGDPVFVARAKGAHLWDVDGQQYVDYVASWGPCILGHAPDEVLQVVAETAAAGTTFGAPTEREIEMAEAVRAAFPSCEKVRLVSSGTEATMSALRLARGFTGRPKLIKADGGYHGHADFLLTAAGSGAATLGIPGSAGVPAGTAQDTLTVPYNDLDAAGACFRANAGQVAALIIEPVAGNMGVVLPRPGYLEGLRRLCDEHGALLVFDEVITGFRVAYGGMQERFGLRADLTCLGKILGGGFPLGAYGGRAEIMSKIAPEGPVYQAGTLSGNPVAVAAGLKTLELLRRPGTYEKLERLAAHLGDGLQQATQHAGVPAYHARLGAMMTMFFTGTEVRDYATAKTSDTTRFGRYFHGMLERGVYLAPSQFEACFVGLAHTDQMIDQTLAAAREVLSGLAPDAAARPHPGRGL